MTDKEKIAWAIIAALDEIACDIENYDYGLPIGKGADERMIAAIVPYLHNPECLTPSVGASIDGRPLT